MLTTIFVPSTILNLIPFIIFISSMLYMIKIRNNKDFLTLKINGFSSIKIFFIFAFTSFFLGWIILMIINPITSSMLKFYEQTKSQYVRYLIILYHSIKMVYGLRKVLKTVKELLLLLNLMEQV